ncbi:MAG TPA: NYN domain-containing protein [Bacteroidia bacterium]|nr:NYN domain-containing protein [Bacteroidia bacterium]
MAWSGGGVAARKTHYLFIDGACLDKILQEVGSNFFFPSELTIDYKQIKAKGGFDKVFYYHALPGKEHDETNNDYENRIELKESSFNSLKLLPDFHVFEGVTYGRRGKIRQKAVDIKISVDMLKHTINGNMERATLLASDLDFKPLLDALLMEGMHTTLWYKKNTTNKELLYSADRAVPITIEQVFDWMPLSFAQGIKLPYIHRQPTDRSGMTKQKDLLINKQSGILFKTNKEFIIEYSQDHNSATYASHSNYESLKYFLEHDKGLVIEEV